MGLRETDTVILNGFGRCLGDGVIGLQALAIAIQAGAIAPNPVLLRLPGLPSITRELYHVASDLASIQTLPWADEQRGTRSDAAAAFATSIDLRDFAFDPAFRRVAMIDYFLRFLGLDPDTVAPALKRNTWLAPRVRPTPPPRRPGYVLVCPSSSMTLRCMPLSIHDAVVRWLRTNTSRQVLTQATLPRETTLAGLCGLVASAALVISTDTAMVHLADAFSVPCVAFFTTHDPLWRVRDYAVCTPIHLPAALPPALEFSRGSADELAACAAWFPRGADLSWLEQILARATAEYVS